MTARDWSEYDVLFDFMAQREDAKEAGDVAEFDYWRGYTEGVADMAGIDMEAAEKAYTEMQEWAAGSMEAAARVANRRWKP